MTMALVKTPATAQLIVKAIPNAPKTSIVESQIVEIKVMIVFKSHQNVPVACVPSPLLSQNPIKSAIPKQDSVKPKHKLVNTTVIV